MTGAPIGTPHGPETFPWRTHLERIDDAVTHGDASRASRACEDAYHAAREGRSWDGLLAVGAACLKAGQVAGRRWPAVPSARRSFFAAVFLACQDESLDGVVQTARAFALLGDRPAVDECLGLADLMVCDDSEARGRLQALVADLRGPDARPVDAPQGTEASLAD